MKVFVQVELGRYTIISGKKTMAALSDVPGPRIRGRGNWITWYWLLMFVAILGQQGGIVGGVGQALAISAPLTQGGRDYNAYAEADTQLIVAHAEWAFHRRRIERGDEPARTDVERAEQKIARLNRDSVRHLSSLIRASGTPAELTALDAARQVIGELDVADERRDQLITQSSLVLFYEHQRADMRATQGDDERDRQTGRQIADLDAALESLRSSVGELETELELSCMARMRAVREIHRPAAPLDDKVWATIVTGITIAMLLIGRYGFVQSLSTSLVGAFTLVTIVNLLMLQTNPAWAVSIPDIVDGLRFRLPERPGAVRTALATFGIIGVGAGELIAYPYWCLEKGYGRFTGPRDDSPQWGERARGWMRVMRWDAWTSMVVYTFATVAFYLLGAAILAPTRLDPKGAEMIRYLAVMYEPVFGSIAQTVFLFGAFAVLYSTFFVAMASLARVFSDVLSELSLARRGEDAHQSRARVLSVALSVVCVLCYWTGWEPQSLVLMSGLMQSIMLPVLAGAALYFRYRLSDPRVTPGRAWDVLLWVSAAGLLVAGVWAAWSDSLR